MADTPEKQSTPNEDPIPEEILIALDNRENIILHAPGGTGKTYLLRQIAGYIHDQNLRVYCTATTGVAALNLNIPEKQISASTLHSWAGVGLAKGSDVKLLSKVESNKKSVYKWRNTDVLIIDEVSMLGAEFLDKLDYIGREVREEQNKPFGGIQVIFSGDFLQLPPVKDEWVFKSGVFPELNLVPFIFNKPKRYNDERYFELLLRVREGVLTYPDRKKLEARARAYEKLQKLIKESEEKGTSSPIIKPTILYSRRDDVDHFNDVELEKLPGEGRVYHATDSYSETKRRHKKQNEYYSRHLDDAISQSIQLKVGAQVMLRCNLDIAAGLVNGSRGVIMELREESVVVRFLSGMKIDIARHTWKIEDNNGHATRMQIPFILAWAMTTHRSQGATLDYAICDLGPSVFACGQAYVALSRVRNLKGLFISDFYPKSIKASRTALNYAKKLTEDHRKYIESNPQRKRYLERNTSSESPKENSDSDIDLRDIFDIPENE